MWYKSESNIKPDLTDTTSSSVYNYDRRNITEEEREGTDGSKHIVYVYEENKVEKEQWENYLTLKDLKEKQEISDQALQDVLLMVTGE